MELKKEEFANFQRLLLNLCGLSIAEGKEYLIVQRLGPIIESRKMKNFSELYFKLTYHSDPKLRDEVIAAITTNETSWFRDGHPFDFFKQQVLPELAEIQKKRKSGELKDGRTKIRIWCAAASTGQEPFSLGILIREFCHSATGVTPQDFTLVATDLSPEVLARALRAEYNSVEVSRGLSEDLKRKYFEPRGGAMVIKEEIQKMVQFRALNLCEPFTYIGGFDMIFCRNVLIYFDLPTKKKIVDQFLLMLPPGGLLMLGASESLYGISEKFTTVRHGPTIAYRK